MMLWIGVFASLFGLAVAQCEEKSCPIGGIVAGCIIGTLVVVGIIILIIWLVKRRKDRQRAQSGSGVTKTGHDNLAMTGDVEASGSNLFAPASPQYSNPEQFKQKGFAGYSPCKEYTSPVKNAAKPVGLNGSAGQLVYERSVDFPTRGGGMAISTTAGPQQQRAVRYLARAGSHGSLDNGTHSMQGETVVVPLYSQDIIGLGFNISGNISDGIYVSQVHNRGPAKESGHIQQGDRIMGVHISFENMVHEDALTILSYAAPYPVSLTLQKAGSKIGSSDDTTETEEGETPAVLTHPIYRSQSYDDVSKISADSSKWIGPKRTWSEMKKGHPMRDLEDDATGKLKKWGAQHNIMYPSDGGVGDATQYRVEMETDNPELNLSYGSQQVQDSSIESAQGIDLDQLNTNTSDMLDGLNEQDKLDMIRLSYEDPTKEVDGVDRIDESMSYSAKSTLEVRKPGSSEAPSRMMEDIEAAVRTKLPDSDSLEFPDLKVDEEVPEIQAAIQAELPESTEIQMPHLRGSQTSLDRLSETKIEIVKSVKTEVVKSVKTEVQESMPSRNDFTRSIGLDSAKMSDVQIDVPDILETDNVKINEEKTITFNTPNTDNVTEKVSEQLKSSVKIEMEEGAKEAEKESGGFLSRLGFGAKKRRDSSESTSSFGSSSSSSDAKVDVNRNKGTAPDANVKKIRPSSCDAAADIAFGAELQEIQLPDVPTNELSDDEAALKVNGMFAESSLDNTVVEVDGEDLKVDGEDLKVDGRDLKVDSRDLKMDGGDLKVDGGDLKMDGGDLKVDGGYLTSVGGEVSSGIPADDIERSIESQLIMSEPTRKEPIVSFSGDLKADGDTLSSGVTADDVERSIERQFITSEPTSLKSCDESSVSLVVNIDSSSQADVEESIDNDRLEDNNGQEQGSEVPDDEVPDAEVPELSSDDEEQSNMVRSVLKDYFGDKPSLLEQFGFESKEQEESSVVQKGGVAFDISESDFKSQPEKIGTATAEKPTKPTAKGGMAYFVTIDDNKTASLTDPYYYDPPLSKASKVETLAAPPTSTSQRSTPDLFASESAGTDITQFRLETITTTTTKRSSRRIEQETPSESPPPAMISLNTAANDSSDA